MLAFLVFDERAACVKFDRAFIVLYIACYFNVVVDRKFVYGVDTAAVDQAVAHELVVFRGHFVDLDRYCDILVIDAIRIVYSGDNAFKRVRSAFKSLTR